MGGKLNDPQPKFMGGGRPWIGGPRSRIEVLGQSALLRPWSLESATIWGGSAVGPGAGGRLSPEKAAGWTTGTSQLSTNLARSSVENISVNGHPRLP